MDNAEFQNKPMLIFFEGQNKTIFEVPLQQWTTGRDVSFENLALVIHKVTRVTKLSLENWMKNFIRVLPFRYYTLLLDLVFLYKQIFIFHQYNIIFIQYGTSSLLSLQKKELKTY